MLANMLTMHATLASCEGAACDQLLTSAPGGCQQAQRQHLLLHLAPLLPASAVLPWAQDQLLRLACTLLPVTQPAVTVTGMQ